MEGIPRAGKNGERSQKKLGNRPDAYGGNRSGGNEHKWKERENWANKRKEEQRRQKEAS